MLDVEACLELLKKYGYSSTNSHPYLYKSGDTIGICYTYVDEDYGNLERIKIFDSYEAFDEFLKQMEWLKKNGLNYHVRMCLDDYESINPKTLFLRNEKLMIEGEMQDIETFDFKESQREQMDEASKILYEAGDLFLIYDEIKARQLQYLLKIIGLKNQLRQKYFDLQTEVDKYNKIKLEREIVKIPEVPDSGGIDIQMEISLKDRYNLYIREIPSIEEVTFFLKEVWDLNRNLELNTRYYDALREETEIRNEMKIVEKKLELMEKLNENIKPLFGVDLVGKFRKINRSLGSTINEVSKGIVDEKINLVKDKYKYYNNLDLLYVSDYLREAIQNTNYEDLAIKYGKGAPLEQVKKGRTPLNEIASRLFVQYKNSLSVDEQAILVLYSNEKYRKICDAILAVPDFTTLSPKQIVKKINGIKGFSKLKSECYISVRNRINDPSNKPIKDGLFVGYDFTSFETFIGSLAKELGKLKQINNKMHLDGDINMYIPIKDVEDVKKKEFILVTNDINTLTTEAKVTHNPIGITLLKENLPVMYSPYFLDLGDIYNKNASPKMEIREMINFELLIDLSDVFINVDKNKTSVINYYSETDVEGNVTLVKDIKSSGKTIFVKYAFIPSSQVKHLEVQEDTSEESTTPVASDATFAAMPDTSVVAQPVEAQPVEAQPVAPPVVEQPVENSTKSVPPVVTPEVPTSVPETQEVDNNPVAINQVSNGVDASDFNQTYNQVLEQAVESGSMVAIASQAANSDNNPIEQSNEPSISTDEVTENPVVENSMDDQNNDGFASLPDITNDSDNVVEEPTTPVVDESNNQEVEEATTSNEEPATPEEEYSSTPEIEAPAMSVEENSIPQVEEATEPSDNSVPVSQDESNPVSNEEEPVFEHEEEQTEISLSEEETTIDSQEEKIEEKTEEDNKEEKDVDEQSNEIPSEKDDNPESEEDLDKLLDTLATTLPKDLSKDIEDTSKLDIFKDDEAEEKEKEEEKPKEEKEETPVSSKEEQSEKTDKEDTPKEKEPEDEKKAKEEANEKKGPVKTQIVKKTITNPDGTKKVVMVRRTITTKPKEDVVDKKSENAKTKKVVKKIGQPVNADSKKVVVKKEDKQVPEEEK